MRRLRFGLLLAGTAVAVILAARATPLYAQANNIDALVPVPDTSFVPPPTAADVAPPAGLAPSSAAPKAAAAPAASDDANKTAAAAPLSLDQQVGEKLRD